MKIVLDTNVLISGIFWKGSPFKMLSLVEDSTLSLFVSKEILNEYFEVLDRFAEGSDVVRFWKDFILDKAFFVTNTSFSSFSRDKSDDKFINCAISGEVEYLVTGDKDLLCIGKVNNVNIVTPSVFLNIFYV